MTVTQELAAFSAELTIQELPDTVVHAVRRHLLDALGCALASAGAGAGSAVIDAVRAWGGVRESGVLGLDFRAPAAHAAFASGVLVHALDYDDTHVSSIVHAGAAVVPAALAVAEEAGSDGRTVVAALAAGYEIACRMGAAAGNLRARGFDPTGFAGPLGAAATAARIWGLTREQTASALGIAGTLSGGLLAAQAGDSDVMRIRSAWATQTGVTAADLARRDFAGPLAILEGPHKVFSSPGLDTLGETWQMLRIAIKPYPACHFVHAYADAAARAGVKPGDVDEVHCFVHPSVVPIVCEPRAAKAHPLTDAQARFSLPFAVATAMVGGRAPLEMFGEDARNDRRILSLAERVVYEPDSSIPFPETYGGKLIVTLRDGRTRQAEEPVNRGHPDRPLTDEEVRAKFIANARRRLDAAEAAKLADEVWRLPDLDSVEQLTALARIN